MMKRLFFFILVLTMAENAIAANCNFSIERTKTVPIWGTETIIGYCDPEDDPPYGAYDIEIKYVGGYLTKVYKIDRQVQIGEEEVTYTVTIKVPCGATPKELEDMIEDLINDAEIAESLEDGENGDSAIDDLYNESELTLDELQDLLAALDDFDESMITESEDQTNTTNSPISSDPVRLATGSFITSSTDLAVPYFNNPIKVSRNYRSDATGFRSFGPGWNTNLDQRIIFGSSPSDDTRAESLHTYYIQVKNSAATAKSIYHNNISALNQIITKFNQAKAKLNKTVDDLRDYLAKHPSAESQLKNKINGKIALLNHWRSTHLDPIVSRAEAAKSALLSKKGTVNKLEAKKTESYNLWQRSLDEKQLSASNTQRNKYSLGSNIPESWIGTGNRSASFIDAEGIPHLFFTTIAPDYAGTHTYANGIKNYFPNGALFTSNSPSDMSLYLRPDGQTELKFTKTNIIFTFNCWGLLKSISDRNKNEIEFVYDESNWTLDHIIDEFGRIIEISVVNGKIVSITDPIGQTITYGYDTAGRLSSVTDRDNDTIEFVYDNHLLTQIVKPDGSSRKYNYELQNGRLVQTWNEGEEGNREHLIYDFTNKKTTVIDVNNTSTSHYYNERNLEVRVEYADGSYEEKYYDDKNNLLSLRSRTGKTVHYTYDDNRNIIRVDYPDGSSEMRAFNELNQRTYLMDAEGNEFYHQYDEVGNLVQSKTVHNACTQTESYSILTYTEDGQVSSITKGPHNIAESVTETFFYDEYGNLDYRIDGDMQSWDYEYDPLGRLIGLIDPEDNETRYAYTPNGKVTEVLYPDGGLKIYAYTNRKDIDFITHQDGTVTDYDYDKCHRLISEINALGEEVRFAYTAGKHVKSKSVYNQYDESEAHFEYLYDEYTGELVQSKQYIGDVALSDGPQSDNWRSVVPHNGENRNWAITDYQYLNGQLWKVTGPRGYETEMIYDLNDRLRTITRYGESGEQPLVETFYYSKKGNLLSHVGPKENVTSYRYNAWGQITDTLYPDSSTETNSYDGFGNRIGYLDQLGNETHFYYNKQNKLVETSFADGSSSILGYSAAGYPLYSINQHGSQFNYETDPMGRITKVLYPEPYHGSFEQISYDEMGRKREIFDANGNGTFVDYDPVGRITKQIDALGNETKFAYNSLGKIIERTDAENNLWKYEHDSTGRLIRGINPKGETDRFAYDAAGNLVRKTNAIGSWTSYAYDAFGRQTEMMRPENVGVTYVYDENGNIIQEQQLGGVPYLYGYDSMNRLVWEQNRIGYEQSYGYQANGQLDHKVDFNGDQFYYEYDNRNRLIKETLGDDILREFTYDDAGNLTFASNDSAALEFEYDGLSRLSRYSDVAKGVSVDYAYDASGNVMTQKWGDALRTTEFTYTPLNQVTLITDNEGEEIAVEYDALQREKQIVYPNGVYQTRSYDEAGRLTSITNTKRYHWKTKYYDSYTYAYNQAGQRTAQFDEYGNRTEYAYDGAGRLVRAEYPSSTGKRYVDLRERFHLGLVPESWHHSSSDYGQRQIDSFDGTMHDYEDETGIVELDSQSNGAMMEKMIELASPSADWDDSNINSDLLEELSSDAFGHHTRHGYGRWQEEFVYDARGNMVGKTNPWGTINYTYNDENQLTKAGERSYNYDLNGNLISELMSNVSTTYHYTPHNRISQVVKTSNCSPLPCGRHYQRGVRYSYDALGRRTNREEFLGSGNDEVEDHRHARNRIGVLYGGRSFNILAEGPDNPQSETVNSWGWINNPGFAPMTEYLTVNGRTIATTKIKYSGRSLLQKNWPHMLHKKYYGHDILGSVILNTDEYGRQTGSREYDAYGKLISGLFKEDVQMGYNGKRVDRRTGLYDYGFRDYSPLTARFTTVDPIRDGSNWYGYVNGDPVNFVDPLGLSQEDDNDQYYSSSADFGEAKTNSTPGSEYDTEEYYWPFPGHESVGEHQDGQKPEADII